jgi:ribonuclease VapC
MIVDSSAVVAILRSEPEAAQFSGAIGAALQAAKPCRMSAVSYVETAIVIDGSNDPIASRKVDEFLREASIAVTGVTPRQAEIARQAYRDFGKGRHKAGLNFGDRFAYALAKELGEPLLFKGRDFNHTDVEPAQR